MHTADAVVIGAGINGAATAFNLVKRGMKRVVLLERHLIASGGMGRSAAIVRQHYSTEPLVRMVKRSVEIFRHFDDEIGGDPGYVGCGWAFLVPEYVSDGFARNLAMQQRLGIRTREITKEELGTIEPRLELDDVHRIAYEPESGYADPKATTHAYVHRFRELGGELMHMTSAQGIEVEGGHVKMVRTDRGDIATEIVVNAAGPWAGRVAKWVGIDIPLTVTREQEVIIETAALGGPPRLAFSDMAQAVYYRPEGKTRTLFGRGYPKEYEYVDVDNHRESGDNEFVAEAHGRLAKRIPAFKDAIFVHAFAGLYDVTPDWHPILGPVEGIEGFKMCAGFSGHGFKIGPSIGELMAEEVLDGKAHSVDISVFHLARFRKEELIQSAYGANRA